MENLLGQWIAKRIRKTISDGNGGVGTADIQPGIKCLGCEKSIPEHLNKRWCSQKCYQKNRRARRLRTREKIPCHYCGEYFRPKSKLNTLCSQSCKTANKKKYFEIRWEKYRDRRKQLKAVRAKCKYCGIDFEVTRPNRLYCSKECRNLNRINKFKPLKVFEWSATLREVTDADITRSQFSEEIRAFKEAGKKIVSFPEIKSSQKDFIIEGHDSDTLSEDLDQFYDVNNEGGK